MNYSYLLNEIKQASLFDLYRLHVAMSNELQNPQRITTIKQRLHLGMEVAYFDHTENRLKQATLLELKQKNVLVSDHETNKTLLIPYYMLNLDNRDAEIYENNNSEILTINNLKKGDFIGFNKDGQCIVGIVKRLNHKTVTLMTQAGQQWRVAYSFLYRVYEGDFSETKQINKFLHQIKD